MQTPKIVSLALAAIALAGPADAQRLGRGQMIAPQINVPVSGPQGGPTPMLAPSGGGGTSAPPMMMARPTNPTINPTMNRMPRLQGQRWGGQIGGRWIGGVQAPGGWNGYRRPWRGFALPSYWIAPSFFIGNFASYGLAPPPDGYRWSRYYDDAVLIDDRGRVYDSVSGIGWDGRDDGVWDDGGYARDQPVYGAPYPAPGIGYEGSYQGSYEVNGQRGYQQGLQSGRYGPKPQVQAGAVVQPLYPHGYTQTWSAGSGYYYPGGVTTTITVQQAPVVTTTVTEYIEETVYRAPVRRVYRKPARKWKPKPRCGCNCCR